MRSIRSVILAATMLAIAMGRPLLAAEERVEDIAPAGALRVAVAVGPAASTFWATRDASGQARGVTVALAKAAAAKLHVPLRLVEYQNSGEIAAAAAKDVWDISFMPADAEREKLVDQGPPYVVYESTYLVRAGSDIRTLADVDRPGIRVAAIQGTATSRTVARSLHHAALTIFPKPETAAALLGKGELDALAMGTDALLDLAKGLPGARVLGEPVQFDRRGRDHTEEPPGDAGVGGAFCRGRQSGRHRAGGLRQRRLRRHRGRAAAPLGQCQGVGRNRFIAPLRP